MKIIQHYLNTRPTAEWITKSSGLPYVEIDMEVPCDKIYQEWLTVQHLAVLHRSGESISEKFFYGHNDWKSLVLYGAHPTATSDSEGPMSWTEVANSCPNTVSWIKKNFVINEHTGRIRFMLLGPKGYILPHSDSTKKGLDAFNIAVTNPVGCTFRLVNYGNIPFAPGKCMMIDTSNEHLLFNDSNEPRLHIIVHSELTNNKLIEESYASRYYS